MIKILVKVHSTTLVSSQNLKYQFEKGLNSCTDPMCRHKRPLEDTGVGPQAVTGCQVLEIHFKEMGLQ